MFTVTITEKGGKSTSRSFDKPEITIGRIQGNDIVLPKSNISKRHARIIKNGSSFVIIDSKSTNGTYINGKRIDAPYDLRGGDKIFVGDFTIELSANGAEAAADEPAQERPRQAAPPRQKDSSRPGPPAAPGDVLDDDEWGASGAGNDSGWEDDWAERSKSGAKEPPKEPSSADSGVSEVSGLSDLLEQSKSVSKSKPSSARPEQRAEARPAPRAEPPPEARRDERAAPRSRPREGDVAARPSVPTRPLLNPRGKDAPPAAPPRAGAAAIGDDASQALRAVHDRLLRTLDLRRLDVEKMGDDELRTRTRSTVQEIVDGMADRGELPAGVQRNALVDDVLDEALGLGPLEELLQDDGVTEILVNGPNQIYVERGGKLELTNRVFSGDQAILGVIERIVAPLGRRVDESSPMVDARLKDGSRVNAIIPPLALKGPTLTIRKFTREPLLIDDLVAMGTLTGEMADFLETCVTARKNILISGGTGSGKTTTLNVLSSFIPARERIITIEDAAELKLDQVHVVGLEARPPNIEGRGAVTIRELVRNALRMRPDRIVVGECRGGEALDMLQAMNTGHEGSLTTVHANGPRDALSRLETMVLMSGMDLPVRAIREQIASAVDIVVQQTRFPDGARKVTHISEITGMEGDVFTMQDIFLFEQQGFDAEGRVVGSFRATGFIPRFYEELRGRGVPADLGIFRKR